MSTKHRSFWYWLPRVLGILFALFLSIFTFDAWEGADSFWQGFVGWLIHLIPVAIIALVLTIAWRRPGVGGVIFLVLGAVFLYLFVAEFDGDVTAIAASFLLIAGPQILLGILFLLESRKAPPQPGLQS